MHALPDASVFSRADLRTRGWPDSTIDRAVRSGRLVRLRRGFYCTAVAGGHDALARAAAAACAGSVISHRSAVLAHGLPLLVPPHRPDLTVPPRHTGDVRHALLHRARLDPEDVVVIRDAPYTAVARSLVDLARTVPVAAGVVSFDAALHAGMTTGLAVRAVIDGCRTWPYITRARNVMELADPLAESPLESVSRLVFLRLGLPRPRLQAVVRDRRGAHLGRCDFYWDEYGVVGEADGRAKYTDREVLTAEKLRQEALEEVGLVTVRWGWDDTRFRRAELQRRIERAFERGRRRDASGFPRLWCVDPP
jgi:hypothetical protein